MQRMVALKYPDICWGCSTMMKKGTLVMWLGTKKGLYHYPACWFKNQRKGE